MSIINGAASAEQGQKKIDWVRSCMPVLSAIEKRFAAEKPLNGLRLALSIHLEAKTANLALVLKEAGAQVAVTGCNPLSTQDDVAAALAAKGVLVHAIHGATPAQYSAHLCATLACVPHIIIDDGGDFTAILHGSHPEYAKELIGGCEETTTGIHRLKARVAAGKLNFPMIDVNDARSKHFFDNRYGTGQSVWDAIMHTTNQLVAGKVVVVAGFGYCSRGIAQRAAGMGAQVIITEIDPVCALEAHMEGYRVMTMDEAAPIGDIFISATGCKDVIVRRHFEKMKDGVLLANAGHFDVEVDVCALSDMAVHVKNRKPGIDGYTMPDGRVLNLLAEGRLVNLAAGNGHPAEIMDMSFALQALCAEYLAKHGKKWAAGLYNVPEEIDQAVALQKLSSSGIGIDSLTPSQRAYLESYEDF